MVPGACEASWGTQLRSDAHNPQKSTHTDPSKDCKYAEESMVGTSVRVWKQFKYGATYPWHPGNRNLVADTRAVHEDGSRL